LLKPCKRLDRPGYIVEEQIEGTKEIALARTIVNKPMRFVFFASASLSWKRKVPLLPGAKVFSYSGRSWGLPVKNHELIS